MARYGQSFKDKAVAKLLPPQSLAVEDVARSTSISPATLTRWLAAAQSMPALGRAWTARGRMEALIATASMSETDKSAWCREHGLYPADLDNWSQNATQSLASPNEPGVARGNPQARQATRNDKKRIKELERELLRKDRALAETAALLVLSKKVAAIYKQAEEE